MNYLRLNHVIHLQDDFLRIKKSCHFTCLASCRIHSLDDTTHSYNKCVQGYICKLQFILKNK